ncbi:MAG: PrpR N-terminal domain-containing protein [Lachnospiraceae bacterium]
MTAHKIKVLGIAPYEGMKTIMQKLAMDRNDIALDVFVGDLDKGVEIAQSNFHSNYDVIISRGGTAELISKSTRIPIIEVSLSVYDILRAIKLAENYADRYAIVGFPSITGSAHLLCDLLQYKIDIFTIHNLNEAQEILKELKRRGYRMILCDMITNTTAKRLGLNAILITSGTESISTAFDQAVKLSTSYSTIKAENRFLGDIIRGENSQTIVLKEDGEVFFSTLEENQQAPTLELLHKELPAVFRNETHKFFKNLEGTLYAFTSRHIKFETENYAAFYFSSNAVPPAISKNGIQYSSQQDVKDFFFNSFYSITRFDSDMQTTIENLNQTSFPVMLSGESGAGKEQAARMIYTQSQLRTNPLITINCVLINDRTWNFITNHYNSPLNDNNNTIFFKDITALPDSRRKQLLSICVDMNLCKRNRIIFSCICPTRQGLPGEALEFINSLSCVTLHLKPLRERVDEIPTLSTLYLNSLNVSMANQIIGFEPDAMELLQTYDWPYNYTQFKRLLNELALMTDTPYISCTHVAELMEKEKAHIIAQNVSDHSDRMIKIDLSLTLAEINQSIIRQVLDQCGGNQSGAAKRLGISRTTLWRMLRE